MQLRSRLIQEGKYAPLATETSVERGLGTHTVCVTEGSARSHRQERRTSLSKSTPTPTSRPRTKTESFERQISALQEQLEAAHLQASDAKLKEAEAHAKMKSTQAKLDAVQLSPDWLAKQSDDCVREHIGIAFSHWLLFLIFVLTFL